MSYKELTQYTEEFRNIPSCKDAYYNIVRSIEISIDRYFSMYGVKPNKIIIGANHFGKFKRYIESYIGQDMKLLQIFGIDVTVDTKNSEVLKVAYEEDVGLYKFR